MSKSRYQHLFGAFLVIIGLCFMFPNKLIAQIDARLPHQVVKWSVKVDSEDPSSIEVVINSRGIGQVIRDVSFEVYFYTGRKKYIGSKTFYCADGEEFEPKKYVLHASIPYEEARLVKGGKITYTTRQLGGLYSCTRCPPSKEVEYEDEAVEWDELEDGKET